MGMNHPINTRLVFPVLDSLRGLVDSFLFCPFSFPLREERGRIMRLL